MKSHPSDVGAGLVPARIVRGIQGNHKGLPLRRIIDIAAIAGQALLILVAVWLLIIALEVIR